MNPLLIRLDSNEKQTEGLLVYSDELGRFNSLYTLELPWKGNKQMVSCIPPGNYWVAPYSSKKYPKAFEITGVRDRYKILFHAGNYNHHTKGCILPGLVKADINKDGLPDVGNSGRAMDKLLEQFPEGFNLKIVTISTVSALFELY